MSFFPQNLKYLRKMARLSQEQLAEQLGLNRGNITSYEKGTAHPAIKKLISMSNFFGISVNDLYEIQIENTTLYKGKDGRLKSMDQLILEEADILTSKRENSSVLELHPMDYKTNANNFREAFTDFKSLMENRNSSIMLVSNEIKKIVDDYTSLANLLENILYSNAVLIEKLEILEEENQQLKSKQTAS